MSKKNKVKDSHATRVVTADTPFAIREAFNQLRTNLMYAMAETEGKTPVYAISSYNEHAGKSTVVANLALAFSQIDKKVLLIDGDMRCPVIHRFFDLSHKTVGLSELISGIVDDAPVNSISPSLDVITSGRIPPNPSELLISPRFAEFVEQWKKEYDIIFIDFPPVGMVTDCVANCQIVTAYIFVVRAGSCNAKTINTAIESMEQIGAKIAGVVLNDFNIKASKKYSYKYYGYSRYAKRNISRYEVAGTKQDE